ncbi:MAG TPA: endolytic transglycosylase MltG [Pyrinomonadaceae bacterium]|nr:endolytic transglycosylase MltG [Pyrinomonadaceae bacterium]
MRLLRIALLIVLLCLLFGGGFLLWVYRELNTPVAHAASQQYIEIPRGTPPAETLARLKSAGVIRRDWPLRLYIRARGLGPGLKAGEYRFPTPVSPFAVLQKLQEGEQRLARFTVIEGWTRWDIAAAMARIPELGLPDEKAALLLMDDTSLIRDIDPQADNLEGYLYPDTYSFPPNTTAPQMVEAMVRRFRQVWAGLADEASATNRTTREIVTIASLIETEAKLKEERPVVSSVIYNRLARHMALGIDSTVIYASKLAGRWRNDGKVYQSDLDRQSPYNTRLVRGLPPGPIASVGLSSLEAAVRPARTDFLYYVREPSRNDGAHNFYNNEADFWRGVQALRDWERQRDANAAANTNANGLINSNGTLPANTNQ